MEWLVDTKVNIITGAITCQCWRISEVSPHCIVDVITGKQLIVGLRGAKDPLRSFHRGLIQKARPEINIVRSLKFIPIK